MGLDELKVLANHTQALAFDNDRVCRGCRPLQTCVGQLREDSTGRDSLRIGHEYFPLTWKGRRAVEAGRRLRRGKENLGKVRILPFPFRSIRDSINAS